MKYDNSCKCLDLFLKERHLKKFCEVQKAISYYHDVITIEINIQKELLVSLNLIFVK